MKNLNALDSSVYVGLRVAKSFTISKTKSNGLVAANRIVSKLFVAEEITSPNWK